MLAQPRGAGRFVGKGSVELRLEGGVEHAFEIGPGCDSERDEMTAEHDGCGGVVCELEGAGRRLQRWVSGEASGGRPLQSARMTAASSVIVAGASRRARRRTLASENVAWP